MADALFRVIFQRSFYSIRICNVNTSIQKLPWWSHTIFCLFIFSQVGKAIQFKKIKMNCRYDTWWCFTGDFGWKAVYYRFVLEASLENLSRSAAYWCTTKYSSTQTFFIKDLQLTDRYQFSIESCTKYSDWGVWLLTGLLTCKVVVNLLIDDDWLRNISHSTVVVEVLRMMSCTKQKIYIFWKLMICRVLKNIGCLRGCFT